MDNATRQIRLDICPILTLIQEAELKVLTDKEFWIKEPFSGKEKIIESRGDGCLVFDYGILFSCRKEGIQIIKENLSIQDEGDLYYVY